jgi:SAM-dependent methyltransferase
MEDDRSKKTFFKFGEYVDKKRWISMYYQVSDVLSRNPSSVLEIGPGPGIFKALVSHFGIAIETVDIYADLQPDYVASATNLPFDNDKYDYVCAFQVLEHLEYDEAVRVFGEMVRVTKKHIVLSLPDARTIWPYFFYIPRYGHISVSIPKPQLRPEINKFNGVHYWEINKQGYPLSRIINDFSARGAKMMRTYRVAENPYHRFFIFEK